MLSLTLRPHHEHSPPTYDFIYTWDSLDWGSQEAFPKKSDLLCAFFSWSLIIFFTYPCQILEQKNLVFKPKRPSSPCVRLRINAPIKMFSEQSWSAFISSWCSSGSCSKPESEQSKIRETIQRGVAEYESAENRSGQLMLLKSQCKSENSPCSP